MADLSIIETYQVSFFKFDVVLDSNAITGSEQLDVYVTDQMMPEPAPCLLRQFFFKEANVTHIQRFCTKYATDQDYQKTVDAKKTPWKKRDDLFIQNIQFRKFLNHGTFSIADARDLFEWMSKQADRVLVLPEYITIAEQESGQLVDPQFTEAVKVLRSIPGVSVLDCDDGIAKQITYKNQTIIPTTTKPITAFVVLLANPQFLNLLGKCISKFNEIALDLSLMKNHTVLHARCNNIEFRKQVLQLAQMLYETELSLI